MGERCGPKVAVHPVGICTQWSENTMCKLRLTVLGFTVGSLLALAQEKVAAPTVPVRTIVTVEARHDKEVPVLNREDVMVFQRKQRLRVTNLVPCQGEQAALELFILID